MPLMMPSPSTEGRLRILPRRGKWQPAILSDEPGKLNLLLGNATLDPFRSDCKHASPCKCLRIGYNASSRESNQQYRVSMKKHTSNPGRRNKNSHWSAPRKNPLRSGDGKPGEPPRFLLLLYFLGTLLVLWLWQESITA